MSLDQWEEVILEDIIQFNPRERLKKGTISKKIGMNKLGTFVKQIEGYEKAEFKSGTKFRNGDTLLARITPCLENGKTAQVNVLDEGEVGFGSTEFIVMREKINKSLNDFIYYLAISDDFRDITIKSMTGTSGRQRVQRDVLEKTIMKIPPLNEQKAIAKILSTLDEKIEINKKINKNLEETAQAIFKHWFVDFEFPDEDGNPYKSSGGEMAESELGMIPKGWMIGTINDLGNIVGGATPSKKKSEYFTNRGIAWITPKDLSNNKNMFISKGETDITKLGFDSSSVKLMPSGTVLFSSRAPIGYISIAKNDITTNQGFKSIIPMECKGFSSEYVYCWLKENIKNIENRASGSTFKEISGREMKKIITVIPSSGLLKKFKELQSKTFNMIKTNEKENEKLTNTRDTLLPKLMSGDIRVPIK